MKVGGAKHQPSHLFAFVRGKGKALPTCWRIPALTSAARARPIAPEAGALPRFTRTFPHRRENSFGAGVSPVR